MPEAEEQRCWNHRLVNLLTQVADTSARWNRVDYLVNNTFSFIAAGLAAQREEWSAACGWDRWLGPRDSASSRDHTLQPRVRAPAGACAAR